MARASCRLAMFAIEVTSRIGPPGPSLGGRVGIERRDGMQVTACLSAFTLLRAANFLGTVQVEKSVDGGTTWRKDGGVTTPGATLPAAGSFAFPGTSGALAP